MVSVAVARDGRRDHRRVAGADRGRGPPWRLSDAETTPGQPHGPARRGQQEPLIFQAPAARAFSRAPYLARNALMSCFLVMVDRPVMPTCLALRRRSGTFQSS
jgi:hypothetical protein